jgi:signal transduction histidine kinase
MKKRLASLVQHYQTALRKHLTHGKPAGLESARGLGSEALAAGLQTLDLAKLHEQILVKELLSIKLIRQRHALVNEAGKFFAVAILPLEKLHLSAQAATAHLEKIVASLSRRTMELAAANMELSMEIAQRKAVEVALKKSKHHYSQLLAQSDRMQEQLRQLSRQILSAQEDERKKISRELHDVIAQTLTGINIRLASLKKEAGLNTKGLERSIASTQRLVEKSVNIVHQFARELRPAVLDDLGLIPALHSFVKIFSKRTHLRVRLQAFAGIEQLDIAKRTVLFRVAQEALTNVDRHAQATEVEIKLHKLPAGMGMNIHDNGKTFNVESASRIKGRKRLGLLGMRERLEMVGGTFCVESSPGQGTTIQAEIPFAHIPKDALKKSGKKTSLECL